MNDVEAILALTDPAMHALTTRHKEFAENGTSFVRYRPEVLPFAAVQSAGTRVDAGELLAGGITYFCDVLPEVAGERFEAATFPVLQMMYRGEARAVAPVEGEAEMDMAEAAAMVELTDVAFPGFFRPETPRLGRYIGLWDEGQLVAMAGERFRVPGLREISAVCTRPGYTGKGYAAHLIRRLLSEPADGEESFLHVAANNERAIALYERLGFVRLRTIPVMRVRRV